CPPQCQRGWQSWRNCRCRLLRRKHRAHLQWLSPRQPGSLSESCGCRSPPRRRCLRCPPPRLQEGKTAPRYPCHPHCHNTPPCRPASSPPPRGSPSGSCSCPRPPRTRCPRCPPPRRQANKTAPRYLCHPHCQNSPHCPPGSSPPPPGSPFGSCRCRCPPRTRCPRCPPSRRKACQTVPCRRC